MTYACRTCGRRSKGRYCPTHTRDPNAPRSPNRDNAAHIRFATAVKQRDKACVVCGTTTQLVAHHIRPLHQGGTHDPANGTTLCQAHHRQADQYAR